MHLAARLTKSDSSPSSSSSPDSPDSCSSSESPSSSCSHHLPEDRKTWSGQVSQSRASPHHPAVPPTQQSIPPSSCCAQRQPAHALTGFPLQDKNSKAVNGGHGTSMRTIQGEKKFNPGRKFSNQILTSVIIQEQPHVYTMDCDLGKNELNQFSFTSLLQARLGKHLVLVH